MYAAEVTDPYAGPVRAIVTFERTVEPRVIVAVSAGHREAAFAGARGVIDRSTAQGPDLETRAHWWRRSLVSGTLQRE